MIGELKEQLEGKAKLLDGFISHVKKPSACLHIRGMIRAGLGNGFSLDERDDFHWDKTEEDRGK